MIYYIKLSNKKYTIIGGSFWYYAGLYDMHGLANIFKMLIPSDAIMDEFNKNHITQIYNCIHYLYENDWNVNLRKNNIPYIVPPIDELIDHVPFKHKHLIYICTSNIGELHSKQLLNKELSQYDNIIYKHNNDLNFDENGFLDCLIATNCNEFYGNSISGFSVLANVIKKSNNYYNKLTYFDKFNILA
jgi:hypothetical protein